MRYFAFAVLLSFFACGEEQTAPKPRIYPKVTFPERKYVNFDKNYCNFSFEMPDYMKVEQDTTFFDGKSKHSCWFNLTMPLFNGKVHFTYTPIQNVGDLTKVMNDAYKMASQHNKRADANTDYMFNNDSAGVYGVLYDLEGHVASPFQFILTDSVRHSVRGSLYFESKTNPDSLQPILEFVKYDVMNMLNTFKWN